MSSYDRILSLRWGDVGVAAEGHLPPHPGLSAESTDFSKPTAGALQPTVPLMDPYGPQSRWVDIYMRGDYRVQKPWKIESEYDWLSVSPSSGVLSETCSEQRVNVSVDWSAVPAGFNETVFLYVYSTNGAFEMINVPVRNIMAPSNFKGFPESGGIISMEGPHFQNSTAGDITFFHIPYLGTRSSSGSIALRPYKEAYASPEDCMSAYVDYRFHLFNWTL